MKNRLFMCSLALVLVSGCASIVSDSNYTVAVDSQPSQARFVIKDRAGKQVSSGTTPAEVTLAAGAGYFKRQNYTVELSKAGYDSETTSLSGDIDGWYWANLLLGGVVGMVGVDPATGAMYKLPPSVEGVLETSAPVAYGIENGRVSRHMVFGINYSRIEQFAYHNGCDHVKTVNVERPMEWYEMTCEGNKIVKFVCEWNDCVEES